MEVYPREIERVLLLHPDVERAVAFPIPDAKFGETAGAAVVLYPGATVLPRDLKWFAFTHLAAHRIPQHVLVLDSIPPVAREELARVLGLGSLPAAAVVPIKPPGPGSPIFIVGPAQDVHADRPVFGIREPDLAQMPPPHTVEHAAALCIHALRRFQADGPYALGASEASRAVAVEMARQLEQAGEQVEFVAVFKSGGTPQTVLPPDRPHSWAGRILNASLAAVE